MVVQRRKGGCSSGGGQQRSPAQQLVRRAGVARAVVVVVEGGQVASTEALPMCQSPRAVERRGHQPCGPVELVGRGGGGGRSWGGVLTINVKLSSVAGSFEM